MSPRHHQRHHRTTIWDTDVNAPELRQVLKHEIMHNMHIKSINVRTSPPVNHHNYTNAKAVLPRCILHFPQCA
jgi:hypothetical protein